MKNTFVLSVLFILSACATNEILYTDAYGRTVYKAQCDQNGGLDMGDCIQLMGRQCPFGYNILMASENPKGFLTSNQIFGNATSNTYGNANAYAFGNNAFANGYSNSYTNVNLNSWGGGFVTYSRYIIYTCR